MNIFRKIFSVYNENTHKVICILGFKIKQRNYKQEIELLKKEFNKKLRREERQNLLRLQKMLPLTSIKIIETHIIDYCNLNCKGCDHFAPLAPKTLLTLSEFESDLTRLYELTKGNIETFVILGGEPLLHPQCIEFYETARRIFPESQIKLVTNGILLLEQSDDFYERCAKSNIMISPTKYNIDINWDLVREKCKQFGVVFDFYFENQHFHKHPLDLSGSQNPSLSYLNCQIGWPRITYLDHGKIYRCSTEAYMRFFSDYFKKDIKIPETDYIDIYKIKDVQEILNFMITPPQFCSHCIKKRNSEYFEWETSKKEISEWV